MQQQKGFIFLPLIIAFAASVIVSTVFISQTKSTDLKSYLGNLLGNTVATLTPTPTPLETAEPTPTVIPLQSPTPASTVTKATTKPTATKTPAAAVSTSSCGINMLSDPQNSLNVNLVYSASSTKGAYMTGAKWDYDGNGSWDTDMSQSNGNITKTFASAGTYNVKLELKMSDGTTASCSKSISVPIASTGYTAKLTGQIYRDVNCNAIHEPSEGGVPSVTVNLYDYPNGPLYATVTSDSNGYYSYSTNLGYGGGLSLEVGPVAASGYKINTSNPYFASFSQSHTSVNIDFPQVPAENVGLCM